jgi:hypothetical protein
MSNKAEGLSKLDGNEEEENMIMMVGEVDEG